METTIAYLVYQLGTGTIYCACATKDLAKDFIEKSNVEFLEYMELTFISK
jgi:hypothetical protein